MNPKYFGDSYDIVKQSLLRWLSPTGAWVTHPMFTERFSPEESDDFARLIGTPLLSLDVLTTETDRAKYFAPARNCRENVFLDPDKGIRLKPMRGEASPLYIFAGELLEIAGTSQEKLVLVFDKALARGSEPEELHAKMRTFEDHGIHAVAYTSHACFVLLGRNDALVNSAFEVLMNESHLPRSRFLA
jgi:hypothetical protein